MRAALMLFLSLALFLKAQEFRPPLTTQEGYSVPQPGHTFTFPRDHGSHPDFKIEWWYVTGHLFSAEKRRFGFQATFFRQAQRPPQAVGEGGAPTHIHLAHMALLDEEGNRFIHQERLGRDGWDASASTSGLDVRHGPWSLKMGADEKMELLGGVNAEASWKLSLIPMKPLVVFGDNGVSRKSSSPTASSHYLTWPRLKVSGSLDLGGKTLPVTGEAWLDHEISSNQLTEEQSGWDWASIQLDDGREVMVYRLRGKNGVADPYSSLTWIDQSGGLRSVKAEGFRWEAKRHWKSPETGGTYPIENLIAAKDPVTGIEEVFHLRPLKDEQELKGRIGGISYWEGACQVTDASGKIVGKGFVELTGYAKDLSGAL